MPHDHRLAMPQVTTVDDQFGTHRPTLGIPQARVGRSLNATVSLNVLIVAYLIFRVTRRRTPAHRMAGCPA